MMTALAKNLLFLFSDQHAAAIMGCAGDANVQTPALDRLAAAGTRFENAYCASPICVPSRMSMLTACNPSTQDCWTNDDPLGQDRPTWPQALGVAGHHPELIGRMHSVGLDQMRGYLHREVGDHSPNWPGSAWHNMGPLQGANDPNPESLVACGAGVSAYELKDRDVTEAALVALDRIAAEGRPFCLTVGFMLPHAPFVAASKWVDHYLNILPPPEIPHGADEHPWIAWWRHNRGIEAVPDRKSRLARAAYWGLVSAMDEMIGRILDRVEALGLGQDTLIVYASDHGDHVGNRGLWWKHTFFDESAKVPMILSLPGVVPEGAASRDVVGLIDLAQTMVEALGATPLPDADGRSFWQRLTAGGQGWEDLTFSEYCTDAVPAWTGGRAVQQRMVRQGVWKLHYYHGDPPLLFNLADDPTEQRNLAADPAQADRLARMLALVLRDWNPEAIRLRMERRRTRKDALAAWARATGPENRYLWPLRPEMNRLEGP
jgi:choline-sulfatase